MILDPDKKTFNACGDLLQIGEDDILYVDGGKEAAAEKHKSYFRDIARITVIRSKANRRVRAVEYKMKRQLFAFTAFRIDGCGRAEMEEIAGLLKNRTQGFPIQWVDKRGDVELFPFFILAVFAAILGYIAFLVWRYPVLSSSKSDNGVLLALTLLGSIAICIAVYGALFWRKPR